jgi:hypothetical protein
MLNGAEPAEQSFRTLLSPHAKEKWDRFRNTSDSDSKLLVALPRRKNQCNARDPPAPVNPSVAPARLEGAKCCIRATVVSIFMKGDTHHSPSDAEWQCPKACGARLCQRGDDPLIDGSGVPCRDGSPFFVTTALLGH